MQRRFSLEMPVPHRPQPLARPFFPILCRDTKFPIGKIFFETVEDGTHIHLRDTSTDSCALPQRGWGASTLRTSGRDPSTDRPRSKTRQVEIMTNVRG